VLGKKEVEEVENKNQFSERFFKVFKDAKQYHDGRRAMDKGSHEVRHQRHQTPFVDKEEANKEISCSRVAIWAASWGSLQRTIGSTTLTHLVSTNE
jgi:hypothetical protein